MEDVPRDFWEGIGSNDLLFIDNSHRSFPNSDVTVFFAEVLPALKPAPFGVCTTSSCPGTIPRRGAAASTMSSIYFWHICWAVATETKSYFRYVGCRPSRSSTTFWRHFGRTNIYSATLEHTEGAFGCGAARPWFSVKAYRDEERSRAMIKKTTTGESMSVGQSALIPDVAAQTNRSCAVCGGKHLVPFAKRNDGMHIVRCTQCGMGVVDHIPDDLLALYGDDYYGVESGCRQNAHGYTDYAYTGEHGVGWAAALVKLLRPAGGRILDIGCADGLLLGKLGQGYETFGIETNEAIGRLASERGVVVLGRDRTTMRRSGKNQQTLSTRATSCASIGTRGPGTPALTKIGMSSSTHFA